MYWKHILVQISILEITAKGVKQTCAVLLSPYSPFCFVSVSFSGNTCSSSVRVFLGEIRITETLQEKAKPRYSYLIQSPAYVAWYHWGNSFSIKSCCSGTLFMFNYVLFINRKQWKQAAVHGTGAKLLKQNSWKFSSKYVWYWKLYFTYTFCLKFQGKFWNLFWIWQAKSLLFQL